MVAKIVFPATKTRNEVVLKRLSSAHISGTFKELTGRATITLPRNVKYFDRFKVKEVFKIGDPLTIYLGYDGVLEQEYQGYISSVSADIPIEIKCEDEMWLVKRIPVNYSSASATLSGMLKTIAPGYNINALEGVSLGGVRFSKTTVGKVLEKLKQDFNLYTYMDGKTIVCGKYYAANSTRPSVKFNIERNIVSNGLTYRTKDDITVKVKAVSILKGGKKIQFEIGEDGGDNLELTYYNITIKAELEKLATADYNKRKADGFDGSLTAFGLPNINHGWKAVLTSQVYPERNGTYYIEGFEKDFGPGGFRQEIKLGDKVA
ncbi:MAG: hypothetical protein IE931_03330 [Sphingobacteriales bacterium]|nr:hypothetical protein [Sphingobacteriales bacterium]